MSVCSGCEGKSWGVPVTVKYRRPYASTVVTDSILCIVAAIWRGCRKFESCTVGRRACLLSCCLTSTEARWPIRDGDRVGKGRESERRDRGIRPKKTGETVDRRQNNGSVKAVSPRHCPATCALRNCSFDCCAGQSH